VGEEAEPGDGNCVRREENSDGHRVVGNAHQVGGQGELDSLRVGRDVDVEEEQDEEDQVEVEVEALQTTITYDSENNHLIGRSPAVNTNNTDKTSSK